MTVPQTAPIYTYTFNFVNSLTFVKFKRCNWRMVYDVKQWMFEKPEPSN